MENQKEQIVEKLRKNGCRITRQRQLILDIILENHCSTCKEIYYQAIRLDEKIGIATVYRMVNARGDRCHQPQDRLRGRGKRGGRGGK